MELQQAIAFEKAEDMVGQVLWCMIEGKVADEDVYIKIRVELMDPDNANNHTTFVMSFHFAEKKFTPEMFPYRKKQEG